MKKFLFMSLVLSVFFIVSGCNNKNSVPNIKADYFDIGFGESLYFGHNKVDKETVQSLVKAYNQIEYSGQTNQEINYEKAITITFIYNDQISATLVIDDKGLFHIKDSAENYLIEPNTDIYQQALDIFYEVKNQS